MKIPNMNVLVANLLGMNPTSVAIARGEITDLPVFENSEAAWVAYHNTRQTDQEDYYMRIHAGWVRISQQEIAAAKTAEEAKHAYTFAPDETKCEALTRWLALCTTVAQVAKCCSRIQEDLFPYELLEYESARKMATFLEAELREVAQSTEDSDIALEDLPEEIQQVIEERVDELDISEEEFCERMFQEKIFESRDAMPMLGFTTQT